MRLGARWVFAPHHKSCSDASDNSDKRLTVSSLSSHCVLARFCSHRLSRQHDDMAMSGLCAYMPIKHPSTLKQDGPADLASSGRHVSLPRLPIESAASRGRPRSTASTCVGPWRTIPGEVARVSAPRAAGCADAACPSGEHLLQRLRLCVDAWALGLPRRAGTAGLRRDLPLRLTPVARRLRLIEARGRDTDGPTGPRARPARRSAGPSCLQPSRTCTLAHPRSRPASDRVARRARGPRSPTERLPYLEPLTVP